MARAGVWLFGATLLVEAAAIVLSWGLEPGYDTVGYAGLAVVLAGAGAAILARHPAHRIGWLLLGFALLNAVSADLAQGWGLRAAAAGWPGADLGQWVASFSWLTSGFGWTLTFVLFPDGRLPDRRWRWVPWVGGLGLALALPGWAFSAERGRDLSSGRNPFAAAWLPTDLLVLVGVALFVTGLVGSVASLVVRLVRAHGDLRQQLKVVTAAAVLAGVGLPLSFALWYVTPLAPVLAITVLTALPVAVGVAILRYRLYDLDLVLGRTAVYATVTGLLALFYVGTTLVLGRGLGSGSGWATAAATLVVAVAFRPLRDRVQDVVDRRFSRARYRAQRRVAAFLDAVQAGSASPEDLEPLLREILDDPSLRLLVVLPDSGVLVDLDGRAAAPGRDDIPLGPPARPLGMVAVGRPPRDGGALARTVLPAAGLAVEVVRLRVELRRQLAEVEASRARIVAAADAERRRIERDLHDGAQSRLVSIGLALRHAEHQLATDPPGRVGETLDAAVDEIAVAIQELRELAHGLPPAQLDAGLAAAYSDLARRSPVPVEVRVGTERYPREVEGAAWFVGCEAVTNAIKHARASQISLSARAADGRLRITVADDGVGGAVPVDGSGLSGLNDRISAAGGRLRIDSRAGIGTTLIADLPCGS
jgi:signal transduction histidine kinase